MFLDEKLLQSISGIKFTHWIDKSKAEELLVECLVQSIKECGEDVTSDKNLKAMLKRHSNVWDLVMNKLKKDGIVLFEGYTSFNYIYNNYCRKILPSYLINIII